MSWPYSGIWAQANSATPCGAERLGTILEALCRAVNERREAVAASTVSFYYSDDLASTKAYPTADDFESNDVQMDGPCVKQNITKLQDAVTSFAGGYWYTDDTFGTDWTLSSLLADVGMGSSFETPDCVSFSNELVKLRECLDRLIYPMVQAFTSGSDIAITGTYSDGYPTDQDAWDHRADHSLSPGSGHEVGWYIVPPPSGVYGAVVITSVTTEFATSGIYDGSLVKAECIVESTKTAGFSGSMAVSVGGSSVSVGSTGSTQAAAVSASLASDTQITATVTTSVPSTSPFTHPGGVTNQTCSLEMLHLNLYLDLTSALTDQA